jgi:hypothetical protein
VSLVGCLQELIVIAVLIETDARDLAHVKIRASSFRFGVIRVNPSKQFTVSTMSLGYRYSRYGLEFGLESCLGVEMWTDLSSINSAPYCILPCRSSTCRSAWDEHRQLA